MKKSMISVLSAGVGAAGGIFGGMALAKKKNKEEQKWKELAEKHLALMLLFNQWMMTKQEGKNIEDFLDKQKVKSIAIYGMSYVGERLLDELKDSQIEVKYAIDRNVNGIFADVDVFSPDEALPEVDAIIVTPIFYFDEIEAMLEEKTKAQILSIEDILYDL